MEGRSTLAGRARPNARRRTTRSCAASLARPGTRSNSCRAARCLVPEMKKGGRARDTQKHIPTSTPSRTKARISRLGSIANHLRKTSSSRYPSSGTPSPSTQPSKTESALRSCVTKSDDLSSKYTSAGDVHFNGDDEGKSQAASCVQIILSFIP
jgi:hypothetical protein